MTDAGTDGGSVFPVANEWSESGLPWTGAPGIVTASLSSAGATTAGTCVEFDVTEAVTGSGQASFGVDERRPQR